jgi:sulfonate transport system substrate-binding protein
VKTLVKAAKWASDQEKTPNNVYQLWSKSGTPYSNFKEDVNARSLTALSSPLLDPYWRGEYAKNINEAKRFGLIRNTFSLEQWIDTRFLDAALKELALENFWQPVAPAAPVKLASAAP